MEVAVPVRVIDLHEREVRLFPREELFDQRGRSLVLPETRALTAVQLTDDVAGIQLRTLGLIGYLPLTSQVTLNVRPKFPIDNLWHMVSLSDESYDRILPVIRRYEHTEKLAPHQLLLRCFCFFLRQILTSGIFRGYHRQREQGHFRPKVTFGETMARYASRGDELNVVADAFNFSPQLAANMFLKAGCLEFLHHTPKEARWAEERAILRDALDHLFSVSPMRMKQGDLSVSEVVPARVKEPYLGALTAYSVLIGHTKLGFSYEARGSQMPSFLFRLDDIFESYVRNVLRAYFRSLEIGILDGNKPQNHSPLFVDNRVYPIKPDLIFRKGGDCVCIGEVKYKPKIEESDRYQLISHVIASRAPTGIWISPALAEAEAGLRYVGALSTGARLFHYRLNIAGDMEKASAAMGAEMALEVA